MSRRTPQKIGQGIEHIRWLYWQVLRRSPAYRKQVARLLRMWRKGLRLNEWDFGVDQTERRFRQGRVRAVSAALHAYRCLRLGTSLEGPFLLKRGKVWFEATLDTADVPPLTDGAQPIGKKPGELPSRFHAREQELMSIIQHAARRRSFSVRSDGLPELEAFSRTFGLGFPVPPDAALPLEEVLDNPWCWPVKIAKQTSRRLILKVDPQPGREIVLAFIKGALGNHLPKLRAPKPQKGQASGESLVWRRMVVSRKSVIRDVAEIVTIKRRRDNPDNPVRVSFVLSRDKLRANQTDILRCLRQNLPSQFERSVTAFRSRDYYEELFHAVTLLDRGYTQSQVARKLWPGLRKDALAVWNLQRAFGRLAARLGIPL